MTQRLEAKTGAVVSLEGVVPAADDASREASDLLMLRAQSTLGNDRSNE